MESRPMNLSSPGSELRRLGRLMRKELSEILRDRRTIITLVLMPLLVYPLLSIAFQQLLVSSTLTGDAAPTYRIGFPTKKEAELLVRYLKLPIEPPGPDDRAERKKGGPTPDGRKTEPRVTAHYPDSPDQLEGSVRGGGI